MTWVSTPVPSSIDNVRAFPPCKVCGSREVKKNNTKIDWFGNWKGEWICENDHRNVL
ncbi:hypothetical protein NVIE_1610 [Nitrososphaera viennensis EN76]|uniref:Uncharacterized protein n=1 Tax=Nitrososphaera viennensis EN76 TaxID=926571 RepID=A0A060HJY7_9ARCH|nr:hypothetical protein NVIE_1610 [Nitrososphaera viennensis EN76]